MEILPVGISHDAACPVAYRIGEAREQGTGEEHARTVGILTDLGCYDEHIIESFYGVEALLAEANHDVHMLQVGRKYPYALKQRILGDKGHLSNETCGKLLCRLLHDGLKQIMLGHLSEENNMPELAYETVRLEILMDPECPYKPEDLNITVAGRFERSELIAV